MGRLHYPFWKQHFFCVTLLSQQGYKDKKVLKNLTDKRESLWDLLERAKGFEPSTSTLARLRSTPELRPLILLNYHFEFISQYLRKLLIKSLSVHNINKQHMGKS